MTNEKNRGERIMLPEHSCEQEKRDLAFWFRSIENDDARDRKLGSPTTKLNQAAANLEKIGSV